MIKIGQKQISVNGQRVGVTYSGPGGWIDGVDPAMIKIRPRRGAGSRFPAGFREALGPITNNSDSRTDYFEADAIRIFPDHPLYSAVKAAAEVLK